MDRILRFTLRYLKSIIYSDNIYVSLDDLPFDIKIVIASYLTKWPDIYNLGLVNKSFSRAIKLGISHIDPFDRSLTQIR